MQNWVIAVSVLSLSACPPCFMPAQVTSWPWQWAWPLQDRPPCELLNKLCLKSGFFALQAWCPPCDPSTRAYQSMSIFHFITGFRPDKVRGSGGCMDRLWHEKQQQEGGLKIGVAAETAWCWCVCDAFSQDHGIYCRLTGCTARKSRAGLSLGSLHGMLPVPLLSWDVLYPQQGLTLCQTIGQNRLSAKQAGARACISSGSFTWFPGLFHGCCSQGLPL